MTTLFRFLICSILGLACSVEAHAQNLSLRLKLGYSFHNMSELKSLNKSILNVYQNQFGIDAESFHSYPPYWDFQIQTVIIFPDGRIGVGVLGGLTSTGSRIHYSDYSGELTNDRLLHRYAYGLHFENLLNPKGKIKFVFLFQMSVHKSFLKFTEALSVFETSIAESHKFKVTSYALTPGIAAQFDLFRPLSLRVELSYEYQLYGGTFLLKNTRRPPVETEWDGIRAGVLMVFDF